MRVMGLLMPPLLLLLVINAVIPIQSAELDGHEGDGASKAEECITIQTLLKRYVVAAHRLINYLFKYRDYMELDGLTGVQFANGKSNFNVLLTVYPCTMS